MKISLAELQKELMKLLFNKHCVGTGHTNKRGFYKEMTATNY